MANTFVNLPAPAANGAGAAVDMSAFGAVKTITVTGTGRRLQPFVLIQISNDAAAQEWSPLFLFQNPGEQTFAVACHWMRAKVLNFRGGGAPTVEVGGTDDGTKFAALPATLGNGIGGGIDVSALGLFKTVQIGGAFRGRVNIEISEDGGATYKTAMSFGNAGFQTAITLAADFMRVRRSGVPLVAPGQPTVSVAAVSGGSSGGGGGVSRAFRYVANGTEDPAGFPIAIPAPAMSNTSYNAIVTGGGLAFQLSFDAPVSGYLLNQITVVSSGALTNGDTLLITLVELT